MMQYRFFDGHCDTGYVCMESNVGLRKNSLHLDLERMDRYSGYIQVFAAFVDCKSIKTSPFAHVLAILKVLKDQLNQNKDIVSLITSRDELEEVTNLRKTGAILSIEGGEALVGSLDRLSLFYDMGVRLITLTWNYANEIAEGVCEDSGRGLTEFGRKAVAAMEDMGILIDVSHLSEKGFWDVVEHTKYPFVAFHSNAKSLCGHPRNLTDQQISTMIERNGCIGVNFYPLFLQDNGKAEQCHILSHVDHILELGGEDCIGFGSDFDGVSFLPDKISGTESMKNIAEALQKRGYSDFLVDKICFGNFYRVFCETMGRRKQKNFK